MQTLTIEIPEDLREIADAECRRRGLRDTGDLFASLLKNIREDQSRQKLQRSLLEGLEGGPDLIATPQFWNDLKAEALASIK